MIESNKDKKSLSVPKKVAAGLLALASVVGVGNAINSGLDDDAVFQRGPVKSGPMAPTTTVDIQRPTEIVKVTPDGEIISADSASTTELTDTTVLPPGEMHEIQAGDTAWDLALEDAAEHEDIRARTDFIQGQAGTDGVLQPGDKVLIPKRGAAMPAPEHESEPGPSETD